ncbi:MAG: hypothetical protein NZ553_01380 [Caldilinea sp.]|nr:hypothetical protein [Caldilinea sp.]MDW8439101.1 hypothetical protein [Caldilineaceae bacterium]
MIPAIQLMLRAEREAETQRRFAPEERGDYAAYELIHFSAPVKQIKQFVERYNVDHQPVNYQPAKMLDRGALQCRCAC